MSLISKSSERKTEQALVTVVGIVPWSEDKCPKDKQGKIIPKSTIKLEDGTSIFVFDSRIKNRPVNFAKPVEAKVDFENVEVELKNGPNAGTKETRSNIQYVDFNSTLGAIIANAKAVAVSSDMR